MLACNQLCDIWGLDSEGKICIVEERSCLSYHELNLIFLYNLQQSNVLLCVREIYRLLRYCNEFQDIKMPFYPLLLKLVVHPLLHAHQQQVFRCSHDFLLLFLLNKRISLSSFGFDFVCTNHPFLLPECYQLLISLCLSPFQ